MSKILSVNNAQCRIGKHTLLTVERFVIEQGQHWCVFGPNGSGKSLFAKLIAGKRLESGNYVEYCRGFDPALDLHIISFEEQQRLWQWDNRLDISEFSGDAQDKGTLVNQLIQSVRAVDQQDDDLFQRLTTQLTLGAVLQKGIRFLSSGQIRKVLIARGLYAQRDDIPQLLILDDPLESIDRDSQEQIRNSINTNMTEHFSSLQLCRRQQDILPGVSHIALMQRSGSELQMVRQGLRTEFSRAADFSGIAVSTDSLLSNFSSLLSAQPVSTQRSEELIRLENVTASYADLVVLNNINWTMRSSDHVLIEGPNGCGKSTLLSLIDGENHKGYGQDVFLFGQRKGSGETVWEIKKHFGIVSNELHNKYIKGWRVLDVVVSGFFDSVGLYDDSGSTELNLAKRWLEALGIIELQGQYYHEISFGQQRLVLLARAMVKNPDILILDEPCVGLDDYHRQLILTVLDKVAENSCTNIVYVTHVVDEQPGCLNQKITFHECDSGGFTIRQDSIESFSEEPVGFNCS